MERRCDRESVWHCQRYHQFGEQLRSARTSETGDDEPMAEARMIAAECGGLRIISVYAPNGRLWTRRFMKRSSRGSTSWLAGLKKAVTRIHRPSLAVTNVAPKDIDVWDPQACHGGTPFRPRAEGFRAPFERGVRGCVPVASPGTGAVHVVGLPRRQFYKNFGMRIDHLLVTTALHRVVWAEIDREARKENLSHPITPASHRPRQARHSFDAGWASAESRIATRVRKQR